MLKGEKNYIPFLSCHYTFYVRVDVYFKPSLWQVPRKDPEKREAFTTHT